MNRRGALDLTIKAMFAIFVILFVLFLGFSILGTRTETLELEAEFSGQREEAAFFLGLLGSPCLSVQDSENKSVYVATQSLVSQAKLDRLHLGNEDLRCAENYDFLYSVRITDEVNGKEWSVGVLPDDAYGDSRTISMPAAVLYELRNLTVPQVNIGRAFFTRYGGPAAVLYGRIKRACRTQASDSISLNLPNDLDYVNESNIIYHGSSHFWAYFGCGVKDFNLSEGRHLVYLSYKDGKVTVS